MPPCPPVEESQELPGVQPVSGHAQLKGTSGSTVRKQLFSKPILVSPCKETNIFIATKVLVNLRGVFYLSEVFRYAARI